MSSRKLFVLLLLNILGILGIPLSKTIPVNMDQRLFINERDLKELSAFEEKFGEDKKIIIGIKNDEESEILRKHLAQYEIESESIKPLVDKQSSYSAYTIIDLEDVDINSRTDVLKFLHQKHFFCAGALWTNWMLKIEDENVSNVIFPLIFVSIFILLLLFSRNLTLSIATFVIALASTGYTFIIIKYLFHETNILTNIVPLITFSITMALLIHIFYGIGYYQSFTTYWENKKKPFLLSIGTTILGFASLYFSQVSVINTFALTSVLSLSLSLLFILTCMKIMPEKILKSAQSLKNISSLHFLDIKISKSKVLLWGVMSAILILSFFVFSKIHTEVHAEKFFSSKHNLSHFLRDVTKDLGGIPILDVTLSKKDHTALTYTMLLDIDSLITKELSSLNSVQILWPMSLLKEANKVYTGVFELPGLENSARFLYSRIPEVLRRKYWQESSVRISITGNPNGDSFEDALKLVEKLQFLLPDYELKPTGTNYFLIQSQKNLITSLLWSFISSFLFSLVIVSLYLRNFKQILIFIIANVTPLSFMLILYPPLNISFNVATIMAFSVSFGLIVDGTIHMLWKTPNTNFTENAIFVSNCSLIVCFLGLFLHTFLPIAQFGLSLGLILFIGLIIDIYIVKRLL